MIEDANMEQISVMIEVAGPQDAQIMAEIKFENLMHRVKIGKLEMSKQEIERARVTEESVHALSEELTHSNDDDYYLAARSSGGVVGFCRMTWRPDSNRFQFRQFYVQPKYLDRKIGGKIMAAAKERARHSEHAPMGMFLYTGDYNEEARQRYEHWGFSNAGPEESKFEQRCDRKIEWIKMILDFDESK